MFPRTLDILAIALDKKKVLLIYDGHYYCKWQYLPLFIFGQNFFQDSY